MSDISSVETSDQATVMAGPPPAPPDRTDETPSAVLRGRLKKYLLTAIAGGGAWSFIVLMQIQMPRGLDKLLMEPLAPLVLALLAFGGLQRESRQPNRLVDLRPSIVSGLLGGLIGGAIAGVPAVGLYAHAVSLYRHRHDDAGPGLYACIWTYCAVSGALMGLLIQLGSWIAWRVRTKDPFSFALHGLNELSGGMVGGAIGGLICGGIGGLCFAPLWLPPVTLPTVVVACVIAAVGITGSALLFDYAGRVRVVIAPFLIGAVVAIALGGAIAFVAGRFDLPQGICGRWYLQSLRCLRGYEACPPPPPGNFVGIQMCLTQIRLISYAPHVAHARGGIAYGIPWGILLGVQVGLSLLLVRLRRRAR
jgi:hypothetical protein